jgi:hypothetical protein
LPPEKTVVKKPARENNESGDWVKEKFAESAG